MHSAPTSCSRGVIVILEAPGDLPTLFSLMKKDAIKAKIKNTVLDSKTVQGEYLEFRLPIIVIYLLPQ